MKCLVIFYAALVGQTQCRSMPMPMPATSAPEPANYWNPSAEVDTKEASYTTPLDDLVDAYVPTNLADAEFESVEKKTWNDSKDSKPGRKLERLLSEVVERASNDKDYGTRTTQWLKRLKVIMKELSDNVPSEAKNNNDAVTEQAVDSSSTSTTLHDILNLGGNPIAYFEGNQGNDQQILSRRRNLSALFSLVRERKASTDGNEADRLDDMLVAAQNQLSRIRRYFDLICRKHHHLDTLKPQMEHYDKHSESNEAKKMSIL